MKSLKSLLAGFVATAAIAVVPAANAQVVVHTNAAGSSALYTQTAIAAVNDIAAQSPTFKAGGSIHHFTIKGSGCTGGACERLHDPRAGAPPDDTGTYWAVWVCPAGGCTGANATDAWADSQVDSVVGDRYYLARGLSILDAGTDASTPTAPDHAIDNVNPALFAYGVHNTNGACGAATTCDDLYIPNDVWTALSGAAGAGSILTASFTDIRLEDAFYATNRALASPAAGAAPWLQLGYGPGPIGVPIKSHFSGSTANPAAFGLPGTNDPIDGHLVPATIEQIAIGEEAVVLIANRSNAAGLGSVVGGKPWYNDAVDNGPLAVGTASPIGQFFGGNTCNGSSNAIGNLNGAVFTAGLPPATANFAVNPILREPLSGTMNTIEFTAFNTFGGNLSIVGGSSVGNSPAIVPGTSQEANVLGVANNPLAQVCPNGGAPEGTRFRAIGTGEEVGKAGGTGVGGTADGIGYTFFSFGNVNPLGANPNYGYLQLDGVDPTFASYAGGDPGQPGNGELPLCNVALGNGAGGCTTTAVWGGPANSYPNLRNGSYRAWSIVRAACDTAASAWIPNPTCSTGNDVLGTQALICNAQLDIHNSVATSVADFLPLDSCGNWNAPWGDAQYARSHYAYNAAVGIAPNLYPDNRANVLGFGISATFPTVGLEADLPNNLTGIANDPENGGDAGGCIIAAQVKDAGGFEDTASGSVLSVSAVLEPAPVPNKVKFFYSLAAGPQPSGYCGGGPNNNFRCTESYTGGATPTPGQQCGTAFTCNPNHNPAQPGDGLSISVVGLPTATANYNGVWQVTRIVSSSQIKAKAPGAPVAINQNGLKGAASFSTGCAQ
jgi:hypothetical protein